MGGDASRPAGVIPMTAAADFPVDDPALTDALASLCARAGQGAPTGLAALAGGKNNRVYRVETADKPLVLKSYFRHADDPRDRLGAEWRFLTYAWGRGVRCVPQPLSCDREAGIGLYEFVGGEKLAPGAITEDHIRQASDFICTLNDAPHERGALDDGSEACFSMSDHIRRIDARVDRLDMLDPDAPHIEAARSLIGNRLGPAWGRIKEALMEACARAGADPAAPLPEGEIVASPSDFGFHNALWSADRGLVFLDFEYAGWDDPAKLAGDFFNCPEIPTPSVYFDLFVEILVDRLALGNAARERMMAFRAAYSIKWACIVLNDFLLHHDARRRFAGQGERSARCAAQLEKAKLLIDRAVPG
ncbi:aminoglycoside phosphotransferase family protein [Marivibrio halodurans]|uniref:Aminoglycoside phosphotransferase family protein n=1 Tax=Marivibrio halodurans TaxID=2039722 RepID=A0A8J7RYX6_9PROT|nr:aminoglycoside phosphotransferase family protein [Marivibrio halodurans]MBP5855614.1 aminoglycoside phosphotransferase family protein [Marivibrio halodurans]